MKHFLLVCLISIFSFSSKAQLVFTSGAAICNPTGLVCVGSGCTSLNLVSDGDPATAGVMNTAIGVGCANTLTADFATLQASGLWAGFYITGANLATLVTSITVTLRNTTTLQTQQVTGASLLSLLGNGNAFVQLQSNISFNQIELTLAGVASVLQSVSVFTGFSSTVQQAAALPVTWISFTANERNGKVILEWSTASEDHSDYFSVERSVDGINYSPIGTVKAAGTTTSRSDYSFDDNMPVSKTTNYYRLKQADLDGRHKYSLVRYAQVGGNGRLISIAPNPASSYIIINGDLHLKRIRIYDIYGKEIMIRKLTGTQQQLDVSSLSTGTYLLVIDDNTNVLDQQKLIITQ